MFRQPLILFILILSPLLGMAQIYEIKTGKVDFRSEAPEEMISATSDDLKGVLDIGRKIFAFKINIASFKGFNSQLQHEHFNENYMETQRYPSASFTGKIIEDVDFNKDGEYLVRAKGKLNMHGMEQEKIIYTKAVIKDKIITAVADFSIALSDYDILVPRIVYNKLATNVNVTINAKLIRK